MDGEHFQFMDALTVKNKFLSTICDFQNDKRIKLTRIPCWNCAWIELYEDELFVSIEIWRMGELAFAQLVNRPDENG